VAAAGFELGNVTLLAGALGVGIGFGLQNVVNNFISGLILLFERPVQVGDTIQVGEVLGEVRRIGIRSSTVRTWQGAEVIVPNGTLISEQVVNWTLSDRERRIDVQVGVAYGTDPERVLALLLEVAAKHGEVLAHPAPAALFLGFGDSSLNFELRAWTQNSADWMRIRSDLNVAIHAALAAAAIEIPFPQRDLHLRSVSAGLAPLVSGGRPAARGAPQPGPDGSR
jgi:small-conductance mechanosensitive channel